MKDLAGRHVQTLRGSARYIQVDGQEALVVEKYRDRLGVHLCALDEEGRVVHSFGFDGVPQMALRAFLTEPRRPSTLAPGIRIGPMFRGGHVRRIVVLQNRKKDNATYFLKAVPHSDERDATWTHNRSGWVPVSQLGSQVSGMIVFLRELRPEEDLIEISDAYTREGVFFLHERHEVYVESVMKTYAFGKLIPREVCWSKQTRTEDLR